MNLTLQIVPCPREGLPGLHRIDDPAEPMMVAEFVPEFPDGRRSVLEAAGEALMSVAKLGIVNPAPRPHRIGQEVTILALGTRGRIDARTEDVQGWQYRVVYWHDGQRRAEWMYEWELEPLANHGKGCMIPGA